MPSALLDEIEPGERWKLVEHQQNAMASVPAVQVLGQPPAG